MQKRNFETYQKHFQDFEMLPKFSETHIFRATIRHSLHTYTLIYNLYIHKTFSKLTCLWGHVPDKKIQNNV